MANSHQNKKKDGTYPVSFFFFLKQENIIYSHKSHIFYSINNFQYLYKIFAYAHND